MQSTLLSALYIRTCPILTNICEVRDLIISISDRKPEAQRCSKSVVKSGFEPWTSNFEVQAVNNYIPLCVLFLPIFFSFITD